MINKQLISLINSLSKSEKRYFKINASISKTNKSLIRMFDLVEKNQISSIDEILKALNVSSKKNLAVIETRLQHLILKHLRAFHANSSQEIELHHLLIEIEILINKRLHKNAAKLILKSKKMAYKHDNHLALLSLLRWESHLEKEEGKYMKKSQKKLETILYDEELILSSYSRLIKFKQHTFNFLLLSKNRMVGESNKEINKYDHLIDSGYFKVEPFYSFEEKLYLLNFKGMYYLSKNKLKESLTQYEILANEIESSNHKNILKSKEYFLGLNNLLLMQVLTKDFESYRKTLKKIYLQFSNHREFNSLFFNITKCYELGIYCEIGESKKGLELVKEIESDLKKYSSETNEINKLLFYLNIAIIYFFNANYSKSIYWLNTFLNDYSIKQNEVTSNIYYYGNIINILVHFEAKNYDTIDYLFNQCIGNLKKIRTISLFDKTILNFIKSNADRPFKNKKEKTEAFKNLKTSLTEIIKNPEESISLHFFDFFAWTDSHIKNKTIAELIKEKKLS
jgi:hypothetical protein